MTTARGSKKRLEAPTKAYELHQCALFGIRGFGQLCRALNWKDGQTSLDALAARHDNYLVFPHPKSGRLIQAAKPTLKAIHTRIATLLRRVAPPAYRHSGVRGRSFVTNAAQHASATSALTFDIQQFYPSTSFGHVVALFRDEMKCAGDVAFLLATLCCYERRHVPTGGVHSEVLSFLCHKRRLFDPAALRAIRRGGVATTYVDDVTLTLPSLSRRDLTWVKRLARKAGLSLHPKKSRIYRSGMPKFITGTVVTASGLRAPQAQHRMVGKLFADLGALPERSDARTSATRKLLGHLQHIAQIDGTYLNRARGNQSRLKHST